MVKINHLPLITFRSSPGAIFKRAAYRLGLDVKAQRFRNQDRAMQALDAALAQGIPMGLQTGVYWLPYFPAALRFHFNAHNLVVFGRDGDEYLISDPVLKGRFAVHVKICNEPGLPKGPWHRKGGCIGWPKCRSNLSFKKLCVKGLQKLSIGWCVLLCP